MIGRSSSVKPSPAGTRKRPFAVRSPGRPGLSVLAAACVVALLAGALRLSLATQNVDDAYITYRYAHNVATGHGLVYNRGEAVLGTTAPLWAALLAAGEVAGIPPHRSGPLLASLAGGVLAGLVVLVADALGAAPFEATLAGLIWATDPLSVRVERGGMEASAFTSLALATLLVAGRRGLGWRARVGCGLAAGLAVLLRPEGVLLIAAMVLARRLQRSSAWLELVGSAAVLAPWAVFATLTYGSPVPATVAAKAAVYPGGTMFDTLAAFARDAAFFLTHRPLAPPTSLLVGLPALVAVAAQAARRPLQPTAAFPAFALAYVTAYVVASPELFLWYHVPFGPVVVAAVAATVAQIIALAPGSPLRLALRGVAAALAAAVVSAGAALLGPAPGGGLRVEVEISEREPRYLAAAALLARLGAGPTSVVAAPEIGVLGYALPDTPILDTVGLVSPQARPFARRSPGGRPNPDLLVAERPALVVLPDSFAAAVLASHAFHALYVEVARLRGSVRLGPVIHIFALRPGGAPP